VGTAVDGKEVNRYNAIFKESTMLKCHNCGEDRRLAAYQGGRIKCGSCGLIFAPTGVSAEPKTLISEEVGTKAWQAMQDQSNAALHKRLAAVEAELAKLKSTPSTDPTPDAGQGHLR
jgi:ribosomal protein S27AE